MTRIAVWKDGSGYGVENGLEVRGPGARRSGKEAAGLAQAGMGGRSCQHPLGRVGDSRQKAMEAVKHGREAEGRLQPSWLGGQSAASLRTEAGASWPGRDTGSGAKTSHGGKGHLSPCLQPLEEDVCLKSSLCSDLPSCLLPEGTAVTVQAREGVFEKHLDQPLI